MSFQGGIPGLGLLSSDQQQPTARSSSITPDAHAQAPAPSDAPPADEKPTVDTTTPPADHTSNVQNLGQQLEESSLQAAAPVAEESLIVENPDHSHDKPANVDAQEDTAVKKDNQDGDTSMAENAGPSASAAAANGDATMANSDDGMIERKPKVDPEFLQAAEANKSNPSAEWQFDSSDAESSDDSDTSSDSSSEEESDDEEYPMLDAAEVARILMQEEYGDDDGGKGPAAQLRTANEVVEEKIEKPNVTVTPEMKITELGNVESIVDNMILIKANTTGEYQVLEGGSVLCKDDRSVIGAVADTLGRVQEPLYTVAFNSGEEISEAGLVKGLTLYYVDSHSTYVFTQPLKNLKGTDASNQFDEEVGDNEIEFSDDEAEAEYKRQQKQKKRAAHEEKHGPRGGAKPVHQQAYTGALSYDDDGTDMYTPMKRPDNLHHQMMDQAQTNPSGQVQGYSQNQNQNQNQNQGQQSPASSAAAIQEILRNLGNQNNGAGPQ
ncbi:putative snornp assembly factor [Diplodia seriata]|uniref:H/ACA ribonucleoprotein complex non-core subunit NAF1 n=1 Tax=Diplodia seriata TaxID=420778 RepID=A0A0G2EUC9_9PEZI|nr:putative snornp assembly factor [Diplodia seriata]